MLTIRDFSGVRALIQKEGAQARSMIPPREAADLIKRLEERALQVLDQAERSQKELAEVHAEADKLTLENAQLDTQLGETERRLEATRQARDSAIQAVEGEMFTIDRLKRKVKKLKRKLAKKR
jgi:regulator of replication initiation timing